MGQITHSYWFVPSVAGTEEPRTEWFPSQGLRLCHIERNGTLTRWNVVCGYDRVTLRELIEEVHMEAELQREIGATSIRQKRVDLALAFGVSVEDVGDTYDVPRRRQSEVMRAYVLGYTEADSQWCLELRDARR